MRSLDVLSVPTTHREPKGLFVLESLAAGVPVVLPNHGAFPELVASTGGGCLTPPGDASAWLPRWRTCYRTHPGCCQYAAAGRQAVHQQRNAEAMARATLEVFQAVAVKKWDWVRASTAEEPGKYHCLRGACPNFFTASPWQDLTEATTEKHS